MLQNVCLHFRPSQGISGCQHDFNTGKLMIYLHFKHGSWNGSMTSQMELNKLAAYKPTRSLF